MRTKRTGKILLRDALIDAMLREFDRDMEKCEESPICSPEHYKKMSEIVGFDVTKPRRKPIISTRTKIAIIIIAAALALTSCIAIFHRQIGNFMEKFYKDHIEVWFDNEEANEPPQEIEDVYTLTYVPEGYELANLETTSVWAKYEYKNALNKAITIEQYILCDTYHIVDIEEGYTQLIKTDFLNVYYKYFDEKHIYKWNNGIYSFSICDRDCLPQSEIIKIVNGLKTN